MRSPALVAKRLGSRAGVVMVVGATLVVAAVVPSVAARVQAAPANTTAPSITIPPVVGATLTAARGNWTNNPTSFTYQWLRCPSSGGQPNGSGCTATTEPLPNPSPMLIEKPDIGNRFRVRVTAANADGSATAVSDATPEIEATPEQNVTYCPPAQGYGIIGVDEIKPPARLEILQATIAPAVITRSTQRFTLRVYVRACDGQGVRGALVLATPTPFAQFSGPERATDAT